MSQRWPIKSSDATVEWRASYVNNMMGWANYCIPDEQHASELTQESDETKLLVRLLAIVIHACIAQ